MSWLWRFSKGKRFAFGEIDVAPLLKQATLFLGNLTAPISMMIIGSTIRDLNFGRACKNVRLMVFILLKMLVLPVLILLGLKMLTTNIYLLGAAYIIVATPTEGMVAMLAALYNKGVLLFSSEEILATTLISVVTLPIVGYVLF